MSVYILTIKEDVIRTGTVKIDPHKFCGSIKYPCNSYIFKIYQKHLLLCSKTETLKIAVMVFLSKTTVKIK